MNKNLPVIDPGNRFEKVETSNIWFSAEAELGTKDKPEKVAQQVHDFVKKLTVKQYNSFDRSEITGKKSEVEYAKGFEAGWKESRKPMKEIREEDRKEVMAELSQDAKAEDYLGTTNPY